MHFLFLQLHVGGVMFALQQSNISGKIIVALLFAGSIFVWSIMVTKLRELNSAKTQSDTFLSGYRKESHPAALFLKRRKYSASPLYRVYTTTCNSLGAALEAGGAKNEELFMGGVGSRGERIDSARMAAIRGVTDRTVSDEIMTLENSMGLLATATTTAPFLGLLGTVWGVMDSFGGMAVTGSAMLSAVAPGISGALLTTVVGLLVALPSAIGYNLLSDRIRRLSIKTDNFAQELVSDLERHYVEKL